MRGILTAGPRVWQREAVTLNPHLVYLSRVRTVLLDNWGALYLPVEGEAYEMECDDVHIFTGCKDGCAL